MADEKIIKEIIDTSTYNNTSIFETILKISEDNEIDVEDIFKMLDDKLKYKIRQECIKERKVLIDEAPKASIRSLFVN